MPLNLPKNWCSVNAPRNLQLTVKWNAVKDAPLNANLRAFSPDEAHVLAKQLMKYQSDRLKDKWQTPAETVAAKTGDCEDFAILARALLINGGAEPESLWLLIVHDLAVGKDHALLWTPTHYLDVRAPRPLAHAVFTDYRPIVAYNGNEELAFGRRVA